MLLPFHAALELEKQVTPAGSRCGRPGLRKSSVFSLPGLQQLDAESAVFRMLVEVDHSQASGFLTGDNAHA